MNVVVADNAVGTFVVAAHCSSHRIAVGFGCCSSLVCLGPLFFCRNVVENVVFKKIKIINYNGITSEDCNYAIMA